MVIIKVENNETKKHIQKHTQGEGKVIYDSIMKNKISKSSNG